MNSVGTGGDDKFESRAAPYYKVRWRLNRYNYSLQTMKLSVGGWSLQTSKRRSNYGPADTEVATK